MTINLAPTTETLTVRDRGYQMIANDPLDSVSSLTFRIETVKYDATKTIVDHSHKTDLVITAAQTDAEKAELMTVVGFDGQPITETITISPQMPRQQLEYIQKLVSNAFFVKAMQQSS